MGNSEYFTKPVQFEEESGIFREVKTAKMRIKDYWTILILLLVILLLFLMFRAVWYGPKLTATLGVKDVNPDYKDGEINITIDPTEWTNEDVLVSAEYISDKENVKNLISINNGETFVEYTEPIKVANNTKVIARIVENDATTDDANAPVDPQNNATIIAEKTINIENIDKLAPKDFKITATPKNQTITVNAKTEDAEATKENGKSEVKEYEYIIRKGDWVQKIVSQGNTYKFNMLKSGENYKVQVYAIDNAGNKKASNEVEVKVKELSKLRVNPNGGIWEGTAGIKDVYQEPGTTKEISNPTKTGYTFKKWTIANGGSIVDNIYTYGIFDEVITAEWEINTYTLTFNVGADASVSPETITENYNTRITMPTPTKTSYTISYNSDNGYTIPNDNVSDTFAGWYTDATTGIKRDYTAMPAINETLYAHWNKAQITLPKLSKEGYTLVGWYEDSTYTKLAGEMGTTYNPSKDITLYAKWEINKYTLTFDGGNDAIVNPNIITQDYNTNVTMPTPIREYEIEYNTNGGATVSNEYSNYDFEGWYTNAVAGEKREYTNMPALSEKLYAHWSNTNASITLPTTTKDGYVFEGWYEDSSLTKKVGNAGEEFIPTTNITLYAAWKANEHTLTFDANGGNVLPNTITAEFDANITLPIPTKQYTITFDANGGNPVSNMISSHAFLGWCTDPINGEERKYVKMPAIDEILYAHWQEASITLPMPTKTGYSFAGWYEDSACTKLAGKAGETYTPANNITLYASWETNEYTLTFDVGVDASCDLQTIIAEFGDSITLPTPSKQYTIIFDANGGNPVSNMISIHSFLGWYTDISVGVKREYTTMPALDETLYAHWQEASITLPMPTKTGYSFVGWYEDSACTKLAGKAGDSYTPASNITLYASWKTDQYTLTLDANGGTVGAGSVSACDTITEEYGKPISLPTPIKEYEITYEINGGSTISNDYVAYDFLGWYTDVSAGEQRTYTTMPALDETLYAHWQEVSITLPTPTKTGYTFVGWYEDSSLTKKIGDAGEDFIATKDITLYAAWTVNQYTLTLDATGGAVTPNTITQEYNASITLPTPNKTGYTFAGWYEDSTLTTKVGDAGSNYTITKDTIIYAKWTINPYTLTLDANGGTVGAHNATQDTIKEEYGEPISLPDPIREYTLTYDTVGGNPIADEYSAYNFLGWYTDISAGEQRTYSTMPAINETLYAHWDDTTASITLPTPTKTGYTFEGWYIENTYTNKIGDTITLTKDTTIYAKWNINQYTLTFDVGNDASVSPDTITENYGTDITLPTPTKTGYNFIGWYEDSTLTTKLGSTITLTQDTTIYAKWEINQYTLTLDANGGTVGVGSVSTRDTITENYGTDITLPTPIQEYEITYDTNGGDTISNEYLNFDFTGWYTKPISGEQRTYTTMPAIDETLYAHWDYTSASITLPETTKVGYTFAGWYEDSACTILAGEAGDSYTTTEDVTLYAAWEVNEYTLTFDAGNDALVIPQTITKNYNEDITLPTPAKGNVVSFETNGGNTLADLDADYTFAGWYTDPVAGEQRTYTTMPAISETLYAHWDSTTAKIPLPLPQRTGYTFEGWYEDSGLTSKAGNAGDYYTPAGDITLYAAWNIKQYTLTIDATGGTVTPNTITQEYNTSVTLPTATRDGYKFAGWYSNRSCDETTFVGNADDSYTILGDTTLYANWDKIGIFVKLYSDGELVFTDTDRVLETKTSAGITVTKDYGNITGLEFNYDTQPWVNEIASIISVDIVDKIQPILTTCWFSNCINITTINNIYNLDTTRVTNMSKMFDSCYSLTKLDLSSFSTSNVTNMSAMFNQCHSLTSLDASSFNTSNVTNMGAMFRGCSSLTSLDLSNFNTSKVTNINTIFKDCSSLTILDLSSFDTSNVTLANSIFTNCTSLTQITFGAKWNKEVELPTPVKTDFNFTGWYDDVDCTNKVADGGATYTPPRAITIYAGMAPNIYVKLYTDGTLAFTATDRLLPGKTLSKDYGNIYGKEFSTSTQPWKNEVVSITSADIVDKIQPTSTANWFLWCENLKEINNIYNLDTKMVTDMNRMFCNCNSLTSLDLSNFDTSNVTNMRLMFSDCENLSSVNVTSFNTSKVTDMAHMFRNTKITSLDLSSFDTNKVTDMTNIIGNTSGYYSSLEQITFGEKWNKEVTLPTTEKENYTFTGWYNNADCTNKVAEGGAKYTPPGAITIYAGFAPNIYVKLYTDGTLAFTATDRLLPDKTLSEDYGNIYGKEFNPDSGNISDYEPWYSDGANIKTAIIVDEIQPTSTAMWFNSMTNLTEINGMSNLDTSKVTNMETMFAGCNSLINLDLSNFNTSKVTKMNQMFHKCSSLTTLDLSNFDTSKVTNMEMMFSDCSSLTTLDLSNFDTTNVTNATKIFGNCTSLEQITFGAKWNKEVELPTPVKDNEVCLGWYSDSAYTNKVADGGANYTPLGAITIYAKFGPGIFAKLYTDGTLAFTATDRTISGQTVSKSYGNVYEQEFNYNTQPWINERASITSVNIVDYIQPTSTSNWFAGCSNLATINSLQNLDTSNVNNMTYMFYRCSGLTSLDLSPLDTSNVTDMSYIFNGCSGLTSLDLSSFTTSNVTNMSYMFGGCSGLTSLDLSPLDTSNVINMIGIFASCSGLTSLDLSPLDTSNVTDMSYIFNGCSGLTSLDLSPLDTKNVTNISGMFKTCSGLTSLDLSPLDTSNVTDMNYMFDSCKKLTRLDLSNFDTSKVKSMGSMFRVCENLTSINVSSFDTSNVTNMSLMFGYCRVLTSLDISSFDTRNVTNMWSMFNSDSKLTKIYVGDNWSTLQVTDKTNMFENCGTKSVTKK